VDLRESFWAMVREPRLLSMYVEELGLSIDELCSGLRMNSVPCPPSRDDEFSVRFMATAYVYLKVLRFELSKAGLLNISGVRELIGDIMADMFIYRAPKSVIEELRSVIRDILGLTS
jgi:hypothetical protein